MSRTKTLTVAVTPRTSFGTSASRRLRRNGQVPAVVYGHGAEVKAYTLAADAAEAILHHPGLMSLTADGVEAGLVILKSAQHHPINPGLLHIDFLAVRADEMITATVPVQAIGVPRGAAVGGQLEQVLRQLEIECLPGDLPEFIEVDISGMDLDTTLHVEDLPMPEGIKATTDAELAVFQVRLPKIEEAKEDAAATEAAAAPAAAAAATDDKKPGDKKAGEKKAGEKKDAKG